jgi:hypothetical protein
MKKTDNRNLPEFCQQVAITLPTTLAIIYSGKGIGGFFTDPTSVKETKEGPPPSFSFLKVSSLGINSQFRPWT